MKVNDYNLSQMKAGEIYHFYDIMQDKFSLDSRLVIYIREGFSKYNTNTIKVDIIGFCYFPEECLRLDRNREKNLIDLQKYRSMEKISKKTWYLLVRYVTIADSFRKHFYKKALEKLNPPKPYK